MPLTIWVIPFTHGWLQTSTLRPARRGAVTHPGGSVEKECYADI